MNNWHRNLLTGVDQTPDVPLEGALVVVEAAVDVPIPVRWMESVGLDRSVQQRGIAVVALRKDAEMLLGHEGVRVCKPLTPRLVAA
ncbi:MAG TPA: hypothetical protein VHX39_34030 [Acetobacteraceae bacterium]|jgi:hypothetical protein|nr:hypothetical protein [Acetobacteraceae bacterium]